MPRETVELLSAGTHIIGQAAHSLKCPGICNEAMRKLSQALRLVGLVRECNCIAMVKD